MSLEAIRKKAQDSLIEQVATEHVPPEPTPVDHFAFQQVWNNYLLRVQQQDKPYLQKILEAYPPMLEREPPHCIVFRVGNDSQRSVLESEIGLIHSYLCAELGRPSLSIIIDVERRTPPSSKKPYSPQEKFEHMVRKNPYVRMLRERLQLDIDY